MTAYQVSVLRYFAAKADDYDSVEKQIYWNLSDDLLWDVMRDLVFGRLPKNFRFLDAGGGTGRWAIKTCEAYPESTGMVYDFTPEMLAVARRKSDARGIGNQLETRMGNLLHMADVPDASFDLSFSFHNVLGFVEDPAAALSELVRVTRRHGFLVSMLPNVYHAIYYNTIHERVEEADKILKTARGKFTPGMPDIFFYSPRTARSLYESAGLQVDRVMGFPISVYPGRKESGLSGSSDVLLELLSDRKRYETIKLTERQLIEDEDTASRGNNILVIGRVPHEPR